jgi:hypothetical protein
MNQPPIKRTPICKNDDVSSRRRGGRASVPSARWRSIAAGVLLTVLMSATATAATPRNGTHPRVSAAVVAIVHEVRASGTISAGTVAGAHGRAGWRAVLQQRVKTRGHAFWKTRVRGRLGTQDRAGTFFLRWRPKTQRRPRIAAQVSSAAAGTPVIVRVVVVSGKLVVGQSSQVSVRLATPIPTRGRAHRPRSSASAGPAKTETPAQDMDRP